MTEPVTGTRGRIFHDKLTSIEIKAMLAEEAEIDDETASMIARRPRKRSECEPGGWNEARPCPFVGCKHHTYLDVNAETGTMRTSGPLEDLLSGKTLWSCSLDVPPGGVVLDEIGQVFGVSRERIRQIETDAMDTVRRVTDMTADYMTSDDQPDPDDA